MEKVISNKEWKRLWDTLENEQATVFKRKRASRKKYGKR